MFEIVKREELNPTVTRICVRAPRVARKVLPGQFIILRVDETGERIPLTVADADPAAGTVSVIFQVVGATTTKLNHVPDGGFLADFVGPLGRPTELEGLSRVAVVGGGVGCAIALPVAKALHAAGATVDAVVGWLADMARSIPEKELADGREMLANLARAQKVERHLLHVQKLPVFFLKVICDGDKATLTGIAHSADVIEQARRAAFIDGIQTVNCKIEIGLHGHYEGRI